MGKINKNKTPFPMTQRELRKELRKLETDKEKSDYILKMTKMADLLVREHGYGAAQEIYEVLGFLEKAKEAGQKGIRYFSKHDTKNQEGGVRYLEHKNEYYDRLILRTVEHGNFFLEKRLGNSLDKVVNVVAIGGAFLCSLIFLSGGITGNTILNSSVKTSNIIGVLLFIVGVVASFLYVGKK